MTTTNPYENDNLCHMCKEEVHNRQRQQDAIKRGEDLERYESTEDICERCDGMITKVYRTKETNEKEIDYGGEKLKPGQSPHTKAGWIAFGKKFADVWGIWSDTRGLAAGIISELINIIEKQDNKIEQLDDNIWDYVFASDEFKAIVEKARKDIENKKINNDKSK